jgi:uncharacterized protein
MTWKADVVAQVEAWARERLDARAMIAHGWLHVDRVRHSAVEIARQEGVDPWLAELAALLHDVGRTTPGPGTEHGARSAEMAAPLLIDLGLDEDAREAVLQAVHWHNSARTDTPLLCVLRDADMLDALGAIGLVRACMSKHMLLPYDPQSLGADEPNWPPVTVLDQVRSQIRWFEGMNTETGRKLAQQRWEFMQAFLTQIRREVLGGRDCDEGV